MRLTTRSCPRAIRQAFAWFRVLRFAFCGLGACLVLALLVGCSSKEKARVKAAKQQAFTAGQEQAWHQYQQVHPNSVRFNGPVINPIIEWNPGLTLIHAIVEAHYAAPGNPGTIVVLRGAEQRQFTAQQLLNGENIELRPGDQVFLRP